MKTSRILTIALLAALALAACGGSGDDPDDPYTPTPQPPTPQTQGKYSEQTLNMPADASESTVALNGLSAAISLTKHVGNASWMSVTEQTYASGTPRVTVACTQNLETAARSHDIIFIASKDTVLLTVRQAAYPGGGTDVNTPSDTPTDQPAYSRGDR